ncbi:autoinducer 2 ABC transporter substrate-binding protein [Christensenellaceae bacterium OttesenSCG-928-K19]|nr:autoinducer 2 ABC transporter substrate-binding protein [Christensenellaceae bacterium OttesenSCG-928-K19]
MKKVVITLLVAVMLFSLAACSTGTDTPAEETAAATAEATADAPAEETAEAPAEATEDATEAPAEDSTGGSDLSSLNTDFVIATVPKGMGIPWFQRMEVGVDQFAADTGVDAYQTGPVDADAAGQAQYIEDLIAQGVDAICVVPFSTESLEPVLKKAREAGILVIAHEAEGMTNIDYDLEAFDNNEYGEHFMEKLGPLMGEEGEYALMVGALTSASHNQWVDASKAYQEANFSGMSQAGDKIESGDDQDQAYEKIKEALKAYPDLKGIQGSAMADVAGAARAVEEAGKAGEIKIVGTSLVSVSGKYVRDGSIEMISFWDPALAGYAMNEIALRILNEQEIADGMSLTVEGYENLKLEGNTLKGQAWIDVDASNVDDPAYDF